MAIEDVYPPDTSKDIYDAFSKTVHERTATFYQRSYVVLGKQFGYYRLILPMRLKRRRSPPSDRHLPHKL